MNTRAPLALGLLLATGLAAAAAAPAAAQAPGGRCRVSLTAGADAASFRAAGHNASPGRMAYLAAVSRDRLAGAAARLCRAGVLRPADLARIRRLIVQNGEGATEPLLYREESTAPEALVFQFAFQGGGPPSPLAFEQALRCWKRPQSRGCDAGD